MNILLGLIFECAGSGVADYLLKNAHLRAVLGTISCDEDTEPGASSVFPIVKRLVYL